METVDNRKVPPAPKGLQTAGKTAWNVVMGHAPLLLPELDALSVHRLCQLVDERELTVAELGRGVLLEEPIVSPTGKVVGTKVVANPAASMP